MDRYMWTGTSSTTSTYDPVFGVRFSTITVLDAHAVVAVLMGTREVGVNEMLPTGIDITIHPEIPGMRVLSYAGYGDGAAWFWLAQPDRLWIRDIITERSAIWRAIQRGFEGPENLPRRRGWSGMYVMKRKGGAPSTSS